MEGGRLLPPHLEEGEDPVRHGIAVRLPVRPPVVKTYCGRFAFVEHHRDQLTEDPAQMTCPTCLQAMTHKTGDPASA